MIPIHSVVLDEKRCRGCTTCNKACPTEAIRVRGRKASILEERCIDCGVCIRVCPHQAIKSATDPLSMLDWYDYRIALPSPALYGQFHHLDDLNIILNGLLKIGFDSLYEVAKAAEYLSDVARKRILANREAPSPRISSACPTVIRLICMRFPDLIANIVPTISPTELAAILARKEAVQKTGLPPERIGVFSIVPCPAQITSAHQPGLLDKPVIDGAFSIRDVYVKLLKPMKELTEIDPLASAGIMGISWAYCGGESSAQLNLRTLAVDGIDNVIRLLEEIEDGRIPEADFLELNACVKGCLGGCLTVENPFGAHMRIRNLTKGFPVSRNRLSDLDEPPEILKAEKSLKYVPALVLDTDRAAALDKMNRIEEIAEHLPGLHCGSCGAPSCHAFAEDIVMGRASPDDCIFKLRERLRNDSGGRNADDYMPAPFRYTKRPLRGREDSSDR